MVFNRFMTIEQQKAYERERIEEYKNSVKPLDTQSPPVVQTPPPDQTVGVVEVAGQIVDVTKYKYARVKVRGPDGKARYTATNADAIAKSLLGMSKADLFEVTKENGLKLEQHFRLRNDGHFRMIVGQALRNIVIKGNKVLIKGAEIASLDQKVEWPEGYHEEKKGTHDKPIYNAPRSVARIKA